MNKIYIYVEGKSDKEFVDCCLKHWGRLEFFEVNINANSNAIQENLLNKIKSHKDNDEQVLIIFDADKDFIQTQERIIGESQGLMSAQEIFLFPNNQSNGELETLLLEIATNKKPCECFKRYIECLGNLKDNILKKSAIFAYREAMGAEKKIKGKNQEKEKIEILQTEFERIFDFESHVLNPLKQFIANYCKE